MTDFEFMKQLADRVVEALKDSEITDDRGEYDSPVRYRAESRLTGVGEDTAVMKVTLVSETYGYKDRTFTVRVDEGD